ncbi:uncharacterized protein, partial [Narcine bancroftii]|uniref:uncharacterized protein n=1 Tax=Narcine bancroftii TaxID=1343680 RepID=UPI003831DBA0
GPLTEIFRMSLVTGVVPKDWRVAHVVPLFKKMSKCKPGNYRPMSLTSVVGKLMESVLRDGIYNYLEVQELLGSNQHGFVRGRSCLTNLIEFFERVTKKVDEGKAVDVVYLDFSKAFDKVLLVPHRRLGKKVEALGINEEVVKWIQQWLDGRCQRVVTDKDSPLMGTPYSTREWRVPSESLSTCGFTSSPPTVSAAKQTPVRSISEPNSDMIRMHCLTVRSQKATYGSLVEHLPQQIGCEVKDIPDGNLLHVKLKAAILQRTQSSRETRTAQ